MTQEQLGFRALADPTRRSILQMLSTQEMTITEVAENFDMTRAAVKKHLSVLHDGDLISVRVDGRSKLNAINPDGLGRLFSWFGYFDTFWDQRLDTLKSAIEKDMQ